MTTPMRSDVLKELDALRSGIEANLSSTNIVLDGQSYTGAQLADVVTSAWTSVRSVVSARATLRDSIASDTALQARLAPTLRAIRELIRIMYGSRPTMLAQFGLTPKKERAPLTTDALLARTAKARATRKARNTKGSRQKKAIKGDVTGVEITPVTTGGSSGPSTPE